jgi:hypothetical protein
MLAECDMYIHRGTLPGTARNSAVNQDETSVLMRGFATVSRGDKHKGLDRCQGGTRFSISFPGGGAAAAAVVVARISRG